MLTQVGYKLCWPPAQTSDASIGLPNGALSILCGYIRQPWVRSSHVGFHRWVCCVQSPLPNLRITARNGSGLGSVGSCSNYASSSAMSAVAIMAWISVSYSPKRSSARRLNTSMNSVWHPSSLRLDSPPQPLL